VAGPLDHSIADPQVVVGPDHGLRPAEVVRRTLHGAVSLGGGQVAAQILNIGGAIVLARLLVPAEFGLVAILTFFLSLLTALGDLGLGMSLVRQPVEPSAAAYRAVATFQQVVALGVAMVALAASPWVTRAYGLRPEDWWWLPVMGLAIVADSARFLPVARLERQLAFQRVGAVEITQAVVFNAVLLTLAAAGFRTACFPIAVLARSTAGASLANVLGPRLRGWSWDWTTARRHLAFGLPYQGVHLVAVIRNSLVPLFVGLLLGKAAVGRLEWAAMVAGFPLTSLIFLQRLYVGSFSRLRDYPTALGKFVTLIVTLAHAAVAPVAVTTLVLIDPIVRLVFGEGWLAAVPLFRWLWFGCLAAPTIAPLTGLLHALGRSPVVLAAALAGSIVTWAAGVPLVLAYGETGIAVASLAVHAAALGIWRTARGAVAFTVLRPAALAWGSAAAVGVAVWWWETRFPVTSLSELFLCGGAALVAHMIVFGIAGVALLPPLRAALAEGGLGRFRTALRHSER
jgi:PST family polysaccharide transporter